MTFHSEFAALEKRLKRNICGKPHRFRVLSHLGFESVLSAELTRLGITSNHSFQGGIQFEARWQEAWKVCAFSRTARRIDMEIESFKAENFGKFEKKIASIPWELFFPKGTLPKIHVKCKKSRLYHSDAIEERAQTIIGNALHISSNQNFSADSSQVTPVQPQRIIFEFEYDICTVYADLAGHSLYKRGFNRFVEEAPLQETLAASILLAGGLYATPALIDPMCGSGTFSLEAAAALTEKHPCLSRHFALENQPAFSKESWEYLLKHPPIAFKTPSFSIYTADLSAKAVQTAKHNASVCQVEAFVQPKQADFFAQIIPHVSGSLLVLNPPYGIRLATDTNRLYQEIGKKIRSDYKDCKIALLCPNHHALRAFSSGIVSAVRTNHGGLNIFVVFAEARRL